MANYVDNSQPTRSIGRFLGIYTSGFAAFVILITILEQIGMPTNWIGYTFILAPLFVYAGIGILTRTIKIPEFYVAGRRISALQNGLAAGGEWISGAIFMSLAGSLFMLGYDGLAFILGLTGGYALIAILIAPFLRKFGAFTLPDFFAARYGDHLPRLIGVIILAVCSFFLIVAQIRAAGLIIERFLDVSYDFGVLLALTSILVCSVLGGMRAVTWTLVAQYIVLMIAYLVPILVLSVQETSLPVPQIMYGQALEQIRTIELNMLQTEQSGMETFLPYLQPFAHLSPLNFFALIFCFMLGTAGLPHILTRYFTTSSVRDSRVSVGWSLIFIMLLVITAPAYAAFVKLEIYQTVIGSALADLPQWIYNWGQIAKVSICGVAARSPEIVASACQKIGTEIVRFDDFSMTKDVVVLAAPEMAGLPFVVTALLAAGGLAATLSTANGLLLIVANSFSFDIHYKMLDNKAPSSRRLVVARVLMIVTGFVAMYYAINMLPDDILKLVAWSFSLAAAGNFPALVLGIWWNKATNVAAILGMISGFSVTCFYLVANQYYGMSWLGIDDLGAGVFGIPVGFAVIIGVSYFTPAPAENIGEFLDEIRTPRGNPVTDIEQERRQRQV